MPPPWQWQRSTAGHLIEDDFRILKQIPFGNIHFSTFERLPPLANRPECALNFSRNLSGVRFDQRCIVRFHPEVRFFLMRVLGPALSLDGMEELVLQSLNDERKPVRDPPVS